MSEEYGASNRRLWQLALGLLFAVHLALVFKAPLAVSHDCGMYLQTGQLLLAGERPYVDFIDINPPLIMYLNVIPAALARVLPFPPTATFLLLVWLLTLFSVLTTRRILHRALPADEAFHADFLAAALTLGSIALLLNSAFGQREHLFFLAWLPFAALRFQRWETGEAGRAGAVGLGIFAGVFASLKPHFFLIVAAPEIYWLAAHRRWRTLPAPETFALAAMPLLYAAHFLFLPEPMKSGFLNDVLPLVAKGYGAYDKPLRQIFNNPSLWPGLLAFGLAFLFAARRQAATWRLARGFGAAGLGATAVFLAQHKGWSYHAIPSWLTLTAVAALAFGYANPFGLTNAKDGANGPSLVAPRRPLTAMLAALIALAVAACVHYAASTGAPKHLERLLAGSTLAQIVQAQTQPNDPVLIVSPEVVPAYPLLAQLNRRPGSRFLWFYWIPMIQQRAGMTDAEAGELETRLLGQLANDIRTRKPTAIFLATGKCWNCRTSHSMYTYLKGNGFVARAMSGYVESGARGGMAVFLPQGATSFYSD